MFISSLKPLLNTPPTRMLILKPRERVSTLFTDMKIIHVVNFHRFPQEALNNLGNNVFSV